MPYTDRENIVFTQIAYMDLTDRYEYYSSMGVTNVPLLDILKPNEIKKLEDYGIKKSDMENWSLADVHDTNSVNGFYGCVIDTGDGNAALSFRGSENMTKTENWIPDWIISDFGLLNDTETMQQTEVKKWLEDPESNKILQQYKLTATGHSLGGNLAEFSTIIAGKYGLDDNIVKCYNNDGPGFSDEFQHKYRKEIAKNGSKVVHYIWSPVGASLNTLDGEEIHYLNVTNKNLKDNEDPYNWITRHDTKYLVFNEDGSFSYAEKQDTVSNALGYATRFFENSGFMAQDTDDLLDIIMKYESKILFGLPIFAFGMCVLGLALVLGETVFSVWELFNGTAARRRKEARLLKEARQEAKNLNDFEIDPLEFKNIAKNVNSTKKELDTIIKNLKSIPSRPNISIPQLDFKVHQAVSGLIAQLNKLSGDVDNLIGTVQKSQKLVSDSLSTIKGVTTYLESAGQEFEIAEKAIITAMEQWRNI